MKYSLLFRTDAALICILLFIGCLIMVMIGKFFRQKFVDKDEAESKGGVNSLLGALFGLWGFLLAFTFSNSASRFESVRNILVDETNAIRGVIMRADAFPDSFKAGFRADMKEYIHSRITYFDHVDNPQYMVKEKEKAILQYRKIWERNANITTLPGMTAPSNNMFLALSGLMDNAAKRDALLMAGIPDPIQYMLFFLALAISFIGGFTTPLMKLKEWFIITGFALMATVIIYISIDLGRPLRGFIQPDLGTNRLNELLDLF